MLISQDSPEKPSVDDDGNVRIYLIPRVLRFGKE